MNEERTKELLSNAKDCFKKCMSPFSHSELVRLNVTADECKDLSNMIAEIIGDHLFLYYNPLGDYNY